MPITINVNPALEAELRSAYVRRFSLPPNQTNPEIDEFIRQDLIRLLKDRVIDFRVQQAEHTERGRPVDIELPNP